MNTINTLGNLPPLVRNKFCKAKVLCLVIRKYEGAFQIIYEIMYLYSCIYLTNL